jgi:methionine-rich copper-binding protein CopC
VRRQVQRATAGALSILLATSAWPHTTISQTEPASGAELPESPAAIEITFEHSAQLTSVIVVADGRPERQLRFEPVGSALKFKLPDPRLAPGRNVLHWKGLSADGHVIEGTLEYVISPVDH